MSVTLCINSNCIVLIINNFCRECQVHTFLCLALLIKFYHKSQTMKHRVYVHISVFVLQNFIVVFAIIRWAHIGAIT